MKGAEQTCDGERVWSRAYLLDFVCVGCWDVESDIWREASRLIRPVDSSPTCPPPPVVRRRWLRQLSSCGFGSRHSCCLPPGKRRMWIRDQPKPHSGKACAGIVGFLTDATTPPIALEPAWGRHCIAVCFNASCLIANNISTRP